MARFISKFLLLCVSQLLCCIIDLWNFTSSCNDFTSSLFKLSRWIELSLSWIELLSLSSLCFGSDYCAECPVSAPPLALQDLGLFSPVGECVCGGGFFTLFPLISSGGCFNLGSGRDGERERERERTTYVVGKKSIFFILKFTINYSCFRFGLVESPQVSRVS